MAATALASHVTADPLLARITINPAQCGGIACIRGMRIRACDILEVLAHNVPLSELLNDFPDLEPDDVRAALLFAARRVNGPSP